MKHQKVRVILPIDIYGEKFEPQYSYYDMLWNHEKFVAIGKDGKLFYKIAWENVVLI